jgi:8-hydroxy-5-deazaflavin:NADPH oxidoreductase
MNIGFIGAGNMTNALGKRLVAKGHNLLLSHSRDKAKLEAVARGIGGNTRTGSAADAVDFGKVVILAVGWEGVRGAIEAAGPFGEKVLWSIVSPLKPDFSGLAVGTTTSGSEEIAKLATGASLVAGWPPFADVLASSSTHFGQERLTLFYCGDEAAAKQRVAPLFDALDVDAVDAGPLFAARFIEPAMFLLVHLAYGQKFGQVGARLLRR